jgi:hypothetical protein
MAVTFPRLTHLEMCDAKREHPPDAGVMGLWELMASGGLPVLAKLSLRLFGWWGTAEAVRTRLAPAFEAVAGTLTHLFLAVPNVYDRRRRDEERSYELGFAMGKLQRLEDLALDISEDGRACSALAQGLTASGGDCPFPLLCRLLLPFGDYAGLVASTFLPSLRVFALYHYISQESLLVTACALRQAEYKHIWAPTYEGDDASAVLRAIAPGCELLHKACHYSTPPWPILPRLGLPER